MRIFNTDIQSCQRSLPKWYIYQNLWNLMKKIEVIISTSNTDERAPGLIRKCMKYMYHKKIQILEFDKTWKISNLYGQESNNIFLCWIMRRNVQQQDILTIFSSINVTLHPKWLSLLLLWCLFILNKAYYFHLNFSKMIINKNKCGRNILIEVAQSMHQSISDSNHRSSRCWRHLSF